MTPAACDCQGILRRGAVRLYASPMADTAADAERKKRLAEALRQNLRRRKAQAREEAPVPRHPRESGDPE